MGPVVTQPSGSTEAEFQEHVRLLQQQGRNIGHLPRAVDPTGRRWLYVWADRAAAQDFADALNAQTVNDGWKVEGAEGLASEGPLGPIVIQMVRQSDGLTFALHPLSRAMIHLAFPTAVGNITFATIDPTTWADFVRTRGGIGELVHELAPGLTGLEHGQLEAVGYVVVDADSDQPVWAVPPAVPAHV